jgi:branched-subunit amino acid ABC-type transport system permease component
VSAAVAVQALVAGLATGAAYGLIALGFTLVYRLTAVIAFAHGAILVAAVFVGVLAVVGATPVASTLSLPSAAALIAIAVTAGAVLSVAVYVLAVRPFRARARGRRFDDVVGWAAGGLAAALLIRELAGLPFPQQAYALPDPLGGAGTLSLGGGITVSVRGVEVLAVALVVGIAVERALAVTGAGAVMRAVSQDPGAAALLGVPCERVVVAAFALAGALAGLAGVRIAPDASLGPDDGALLGLKGITAALIGGLVSLRLALLGGLALGVLEAFVVAWEPLGGRWGDVVALGLLIALAARRA